MTMREELDSIKERLVTFIEYKGVTKNAFEVKCGLSKRYVSNIGKTIGADVLEKVTATYPELNTEWLLSGNGKMIKSSQESIINTTKIPIVPAEAHGGSLDGYSAEGATIMDCEMIAAPISATLAIRVTGDSMYPEYPSGSIVLVRKVNEKVMIEYGCTYVLDTTEGVIIKEIHEAEDEDFIYCVSLNPDPKFKRIRLERQYIKGWYKVLMVMAMK